MSLPLWVFVGGESLQWNNKIERGGKTFILTAGQVVSFRHNNGKSESTELCRRQLCVERANLPSNNFYVYLFKLKRFPINRVCD